MVDLRGRQNMRLCHLQDMRCPWLKPRYEMAKDKDVGKSDVADVMWTIEMQGCIDFST